MRHRGIRFDRVTAPTAEPVDQATVMLNSRIDSDDPRIALIALTISAARSYAEKLTGRSFMTQTWRATLDSFPGCMLPISPLSLQHVVVPSSAEILLSHGPVSAVTGIVYLDTMGNEQTLAASAYSIDLSGGGARLTPAFGQQWPATLPQQAAIQITYTAGYGDATAVPEELRQWIQMRVETAMATPGELEALGRGETLVPTFADGLLDLNRDWAI